MIQQVSAKPRVRSSRRSTGAAYGRVVVFLVGFGALVIFVCRYYLLPAMEAAGKATPRQRPVLAAHSRLVLAIVLFILLCGIILTFRIGRFFLPRHQHRKQRTVYPDAWAESAQRLDVPGDDQ